ncbi:MAG: hypothetical protein ACI9WV_001477 [Patiriisocius sp.]|jgi:hypothetical protein
MSFLKNLPKESLVAIEATGIYHYQLAEGYICSRAILTFKNFVNVKKKYGFL